MRYTLKLYFGLRQNRGFEETQNLDSKPYLDFDFPQNSINILRLVTQRSLN